MKLHTKPTNLSQDPLAVFESVAHRNNYCFLLETLADKHQPLTSGQSYIGVAPAHHYAAKNNQFYIDRKPTDTKQPYQMLRNQIMFDHGLPGGYAGGLVGYCAHEGIQQFEPSLTFNYDRDFFDFEFARYDDGLIFRANQSPEYFYYDEDRSDLYSTPKLSSKPLSISYIGTNKTKKSYTEMINKAHSDIQNGRVFQIVLANRFEYSFEGDLLNLYKELRKVNPSPFMFFLKFGDIITMGASPELLVHTNKHNKVYLEALAGTIKRGGNVEEDERLARRLLADEKEVAEHSMLVDLARNDVGRVSRIGTVRIEDLMYIKKLSHVQHISSIVSGTISPDKDAFDALAASFPAGTLCGAPKIEAIKMIRTMEGNERGPYGGTIGYISYNGDSVQAVNIRSISSVNSRFFLHSGSGVVFDSRAEREFEEINEKKAAMDRAMEPFIYRDKV